MTSFCEEQSTSCNALLVQAIKRVLAAMHFSFRALHQQCLLTSLACRYKFPSSLLLSSQALPLRKRAQPSLQPVCVSTSISDWSSNCFLSVTQPRLRTSVYHNFSGQAECKSKGDFPYFSHHSDTTNSFGIFLNILNATSQAEMSKRKRSHSERSKRKRSRSEGAERKRSHSKHSKRKRSHSEPSKSRRKRKRMDKDKEKKSRDSRGTRRSKRLIAMKKSGKADELAMESLVNNMPKQSKQLLTDADSVPKAKSPKKERVTSSAQQKIGRSKTPPPFSCGFTQRDFSTLIPSNRMEYRTSTPPPGWSSFAKSTLSTSALTEKDRNRDRSSTTSTHMSAADHADGKQNGKSDQQDTKNQSKHGQGELTKSLSRIAVIMHHLNMSVSFHFGNLLLGVHVTRNTPNRVVNSRITVLPVFSEGRVSFVIISTKHNTLININQGNHVEMEI